MTNKKVLILLFFALFLTLPLVAAIPATERAALIAFYNAASGDNWIDNSGWKGNSNEADGFSQTGSEGAWKGIVVANVDGGDHVTHIWLTGNNLTGTIPPELADLSQLESLNVAGNALSGTLPPELGNLSGLIDLYANDNLLEGSIPSQWAGMVKLNMLYLNNNNLSGQIPSFLADLPVLIILHLDHNDLEGEIPVNLGVNGFQRVHLQHNHLSGSIPPALAGGVIDELNLSNNNLSGLIPPEIGDGGTTFTIDLSNNELRGPIPPDFSRLAIVENIDLSNNKLDGPIPEVLGDIFWLYTLRLQGNMLSGDIPASFTQFTSISHLNISYNVLYSSNAALTAFLDTVSPGWSDTQTIAPTGLSAAVLSSTSIQLSWTPIPFSAGTGGYKIYSKTSAGDPWIETGAVAGKTSSEYTVTGLSSGNVYYFALRTWSGPHADNQNTLLSGYSEQIFIYLGLGPAQIAVDPSRLDFHYIPGQPWQPEQILTLSSNGAECLLQSTVDWCTLLPGTSNGGEIQVSVSTSGLAPGSYNGAIIITSPEVVNSPLEVPVQLVIEENSPGSVWLNRQRLNFGAISGDSPPPAQSFSLDADQPGSLVWSASANQSWLSLSPSSGTGGATVQVSVNTAGLAAGDYSGAIVISAPGATNSPAVIVNLTVKTPDNDLAPFGWFDTPLDGSTAVGSIPVTGWALDDTGVDNVKIYRAPIGGETGSGSMIYVGDAVLVDGARPDVAQAYPGYPMNYRAGWGYMLLTNKLPGVAGNSDGPFTLYAVITDLSGNRTTLEARAIHVNNAASVLPFGAIDTPSQGGLASGASFVNFGWALTPQPNTIPVDGSTIRVWIDGVFRGHPVYNQYRRDIATIFPGYNNSNGAVGYFYIDTAAYTNGVHTIAWSVTDDAGNKSGIGSRYFTIQNSGTSGTGRVQGSNANHGATNLGVVRGHAWDKEEIIKHHENHEISISANPLEPLEVNLFPTLKQIQQEIQIRTLSHSPLPVGATLDREKGILYWLPGPAFAGEHKLRFTAFLQDGSVIHRTLRVNFKPSR